MRKRPIASRTPSSRAHKMSTLGVGAAASLLCRCAGLACAVLAIPAHARAQAATPVDGAAVPATTSDAPLAVADEFDGARHLVTGIEIRYIRENSLLPTEEEVLAATVVLVRTADGFIAPREGFPGQSFTLAQLADDATPYLYDSALALIAPAVFDRLTKGYGLIGVYAEPDPRQFAVVDGEVVDRRPADLTSMTVEVTTGIITDVRTIGMGERLKEGESVNHPVHQRIRDRSPVRPDDGTTDYAIDVPRGDLIDDYIYRLSRHPGRRVDVAVGASGDQPGSVNLDYIVTENKPWFLYFQLANNGTDSTNNWRERFGFVHNQLTNADDILTLEYMTAGFEDIHAFSGSYSRPFFGSDRLRWRVYGSWYTYDASEVGLPNANFEGEGSSVGGEFIWNFFQRRDLFIDAIGGIRAESVEVDNNFANIHGDEEFLIGYTGLSLEQQRESSSTVATAMVEFSLEGGEEPEIDKLGRFDADGDWTVARLGAQHSFYLEPLLNPSLDESPGLAHEIALTAQAQIAFGNRLVPNFQQTAGGLYTVRGYPEAVVAGDNAFIASAEYRYHLPRGLSSSVQPSEFFGTPFRFRPQYPYGPVDWDLIFKGFVDFGRVTHEDRQSFEEDATLVSVGIGAELALSRTLNVRVDWGVALYEIEDALGRTEVDEGDSEVHFVLTVIF